MSEGEREELEELRREMNLNSLGDRPHSMGADKLRRFAHLEALEIKERVERGMNDTTESQWWEW